MSLWTYRFFGLPASYRAELYEELFTLCYYGNGFTFQEMYNISIEKRRFLLKLLEKAKVEEKKRMDTANKKPSSSPSIPKHIQQMIPKK